MCLKIPKFFSNFILYLEHKKHRMLLVQLCSIFTQRTLPYLVHLIQMIYVCIYIVLFLYAEQDVLRLPRIL